MAMEIVETTIGEMREFAVDSGYIIACYKKNESGDWQKDSDSVDFDDDITDDMIIKVKAIRGSIDFKETVTPDKSMLFRLHNNYNLPEIIPCFKR